jgi:hypothetical protein
VATLDELRALALGLPEATEQDHHGIPSFRVRGRVFATVPDDDHVRILVDEEEIRALSEAEPGTYAPFWWGRRLACVVADLAAVPDTELAELLALAWARKAPASLRRLLPGR